jgi:hypothetical protein
MTNINIDFSRALLQTQRAELTTEQKRRLRKSWTYHYGNGHWEFQTLPVFDNGSAYYWNGRADNAFDAKYQAINAWLRDNYPADNAFDAKYQ